MCRSVRVALILVMAIPGEAAAVERPNIVCIISDDQAWTDYGFMSHPQIQTPNLDRLASRSAVFTRGYVPTALCRPSLATLVTGLYAHQHKISGNDPALPPSMQQGTGQAQETPTYHQLRETLIDHIDTHPTLPRLLTKVGYRSFQSGKWWEGSFRRGGFTEGMTRGFPQPGGRHGDDGLMIGRQGMQPVSDFIDRSLAAQEPFFVWYAPFLPHTPHDPPQRLLDKYKSENLKPRLARYYAMVEWFDETCGQLIDHIERRGLSQNTLVVYVGDNGWIQDPDSDGFAARSKQSPYEAGVRQPIMFCWPAVIQPGDRGQQLCSSVDIMPTALAAAQVEPPADLPGHNLLPILRTGEPTPRQDVYGEGFAHDIADVQMPETSLSYRWVIEGRWKLILSYDGQQGRYARYHQENDQRPRLYDLANDPHEERNLADQHPQLASRLAEKIDSWWPVNERRVLTE